MHPHDEPAEPPLGADDQLALDYVFMVCEKWAAQGQPIRPLGQALLGMAVEVMGKSFGRAETLRIIRELADEIEEMPDGEPVEARTLTRQ